MKNKSQRHKSDNTFKFKSFSERIDSIDVDIFHRVGHEYETQTDEDECYFQQAIQKWNVLNLTEGYSSFKKEIKPFKYVTIVQLLQQKDFVIEVLLKHLKDGKVLYLQPLLDITIAIAKDLRKDFYPYYPQFLVVLIELLVIRDPEVIEWVFTCLAHLFKTLWRVLIKDIKKVVKLLIPLLSDDKPDYVQNFASESFAYVARKVKDKKEFLHLILKAVDDGNGTTGCGKLLFEVIHGVNGHFHSCADNLLPLLLQTTKEESISISILKSILVEIVNNIAQKIYPQRNELLWKTYISHLDDFNGTAPNSSEQLIMSQQIILQLIEQTITYHNGKLLVNPVLIAQTLVRLLSKKQLPSELQFPIVKICVLLLTSTNIKLPQEHASEIIKIVLTQNDKVLLYFVKNVQQIVWFEALVLPTFLRHCLKNDLEEKWLHGLTELVLKKSPLCGSGIGLESWIRYPLDLNAKECNLSLENILYKLLNLNLDGTENLHIGEYTCAVICLPHLNLSRKNEIVEKLSENIRLLCSHVNGKLLVDNFELNKILFVINISVECLIHVVQDLDLISEHLILFLGNLLPLANNVNFISSLKTLDMYLTAMRNKEHVITMGNLCKLYDALEFNLTSPHKEVRLLTTHIFTLFEKLLQSPNNTEEWAVFSICYNVENIESHVHTYRDQLQNLEKLKFNRQQMERCRGTHFEKAPLRYLLGTLYMNFKLLWDPVISIIVSHAEGLETESFWNIFVAELKTAMKDSEERKCYLNDLPTITDAEFINSLFINAHKIDSCPDYVNYRQLLWRAIAFFPEIAEAKTRDVSDLFLNFIECEYKKSNSSVAMTWNIKQNEENGIARSDSIKTDSLSGKNILRLLISHLTVFTKIRSPKSMYREAELHKLYMDLLSHKNQEVQKLALDCLLTYKNKSLTPYSSHLHNLIDDRNFKNEILNFRVDQETQIVQREHREALMPVVMNIVYSKMFAKTGPRTGGGKASGQWRRNLILRFLAGCAGHELMRFIEMIFKFYAGYVRGDLVVMVGDIESGVDLEKFLPPKRLQSSLNLLAIVLEKFGGLMGDELLSYLLKISLIIGAHVKAAFARLSKVHAGYLPALKGLRVDGVKIIGKFFERFEKYPWNRSEIDAVFEVFVWPYVEKLPTEGIHRPTTLLKLFGVWGANPRFFPLLTKYHGEDKERNALANVVKLMLNKKTQNVVVKSIMEMFEKLLTLEEGAEDLKIDVANVLPIHEDILKRLSLNSSLNYGSCILLPHVPSVLTVIKSKLENKSRVMTQCEVFILSRISELVWEPEVSDTILQLLLPLAFKKCGSFAGEEVVSQLLTTVNNLLKNVDAPAKHFRQICPLFGVVRYASGRKILCEMLSKVSNAGEFDVIAELNSWDRKWVDQPDFQRRFDAFNGVKKTFQDGTLGLDLGVLLIYNCYYLIQNEKDLSLRENSIDALKTIVPLLLEKFVPQKDYILNSVMFPLLAQWMRNKNEDVRNESISLLGHLARECPRHHVVLRDLNKLTNKVDLEVDFFENLVHLQLHRRARALLKFSTVFKEEEATPNSRTLTQFILPFATHYLCNEKYAAKNNLVDGAIEVIGTVCRFLPWHQYEALLKFYLGKLKHKVEFQKQLVRTTVAILDAFHFDLGKVESERMVEMLRENVNNKSPLSVADRDKKENETESGEGGEEGDAEESKEDENVSSNEEDKELSDEIEEALNDAVDVESDSDELEADKIANEIKVKAYDKITVLCKSTANRVTKIIQMVLLPQLNNVLAEMTQYEHSHKVNRKVTGIEREEEDLLRVPISLAVVKLLQRLPKTILDANLPRVLMKLCTFLKSKLDSVRRVARETLQKIMTGLGPEYLPMLLSEITPLLSRGFEVHVLIFTVHGVLNCLKETYRPGDVDKILLTVVELCRVDLFGVVAEEKEVAKIVTKLPEAKSTKSFDTLQTLARYITEKCLMDLLLPLKNTLTHSHSYKVVNRAQECLRFIALGLVENDFVPVQSLLKFTYGVISESIPELVSSAEKPEAKPESGKCNKLLLQREDCFVIPKAPTSVFKKQSVKVSAKTNAHVLIEFGIRICHLLLKKEKLKDDDYEPYIDPFVGLFKKCLNSRHVKLSTLTLQTLAWVMKYDLPSLKDNIKEIANAIFAILHKYASAGLSKGDNFDLVIAAFKAMAVLVREVTYYTVEEKQLKLLLFYIEQDLHDHDRQATAFALIKAVIARKFNAPEIHAVMRKVAEISITSALEHVRVQARTVFHHFIMDYTLGKKLEKYVDFYVSQLGYELRYGRESALDMINNFIKSFPLNILRDYSGMFLVTLGARLMNDEIPECRIKVAAVLKSMFLKLEKEDRSALFDIIQMWMKEKKISHKVMAAQLCGIMIKVETGDFHSRLESLMPTILLQFGLADDEEHKPGQFVLLKKKKTDKESHSSEEEERIKDHHMFQVLNMLLKLCALCPQFLKMTKDIETLSDYVQTLLNHPHEWVRLAAAQFLGFVLTSVNIEHLSELLMSHTCDSEGYLCSDPLNMVKSLTLDLCVQLQPGSVKEELAEQVVKNLIFIARALEKMPIDKDKGADQINLLWLTKRMRKIVNAEIVETPSSVILRTEVFKWTAGIVTVLENEKLEAVLNHLIAPLVREMMTTEESNAPLRQLAKEVGKMIKKRVGAEVYTKALSNLQQHLLVKRSERKRTRNQLAVTDPEMYAKKKIKHQEKKKVVRKRKLEQMKGVRKRVKRKKVVDLESDEIF